MPWWGAIGLSRGAGVEQLANQVVKTRKRKQAGRIIVASRLRQGAKECRDKARRTSSDDVKLGSFGMPARPRLSAVEHGEAPEKVGG